MTDKRPLKAKKASKHNDLPWWVEVMFVQIGLPDGLLRWLLKTRKAASFYIKEQKKPLSYSLITLATLLYLFPTVREAQLHNQCVEGSREYVKRNMPTEAGLSRNSINAWANRFCKGGNI